MNRSSFKLLFIGILLSFIIIKPAIYAQNITSENPSRNDHIFPPSSEASSYINFDKRGFIINAQRTFIVSAGIEYARVPRELWQDRLLKLKRGGYNAVEIYTFWNFHEPLEGEFNFSENRDLDAFLKLVKEMNMFAIVRVGPYYCGEWNFGGYPIWLKFKPGLVARRDNPAFLDATDKFFEQLIPIVAKNQIHNGGSVILVQIENEHPEGWGTIVPNSYFTHLMNKVVSLGIQIPYFFSGLHPGNDPAGNVKNLDDPKRPNPWFSTEFWGVWFFNYGPQPQDSTIYDRRTWKIIAHGGNGYNVYMAHGGSNFEYNNDRDMAASYDYGAGIGQAGDLRPIYYAFKRAAWFARSFQNILANSIDGGDMSNWMMRDTSIKVNTRTSPAGSITFLDNPGKMSKSAFIQPPKSLTGASAVPIKIAEGEIVPVVQNFTITTGIKLDWAPARIYSILLQGETTTVVTYGVLNTPIHLFFSTTKDIKIIKGNFNYNAKLKKINLSTVVNAETAEFIFEADGKRLRILVMPSSTASRSWMVENEDANYLITGPSYVGKTQSADGRVTVSTARAWSGDNDIPAIIYKEKTDTPLSNRGTKISRENLISHLSKWEMEPAIEPTLTEFNDSNWKQSNQPLQMGADGDITANAWYRTKVSVDTAGTYILKFKNLRERATLFLNGEKQSAELIDKSFTIDLEAKKTNTLSIFTAHNGRNKQLFYLGGLDTIDVKGITGPVTLELANSSAVPTIISNWKMKGGPGDPFILDGWKTIQSGDFPGPVFFRSTFTLPKLSSNRTVIWRVNITSMGHGSVWVNGHNLGRYPEKIKVFGLYIPEVWMKEGENSIVVYDEDGIHPGKIAVEVEKAASRENILLTEIR